MITAEYLERLITPWLQSQRWFAGKGRENSVRLEPIATLPGSDPEVTIWTASVAYEDGTSELYQLPLVLRDVPADSLEHVLIGSIESGTGTQWIYDALYDKEVTAPWLIGIRDETVSGPLQFFRTAGADAIPVAEPSLAMTAEQSNTSLMFSDIAILKVFRRLQPGVNPDIEIHEALSELGAAHIPRLLGAVTAELAGESYALAMLQEFMTTATDGWELAKASVRDLMAEADLHAEEAGGDFAGEAERLGTAVAQVHAELSTAFGVSPPAADDLRDRAAAMHARLDHAVSVVPELAELADGLHANYDAFAAATADVTLQRIHGDLHLGQALRTVRRWVIIDFEGEPMAELAARRLPDSPLRDVAGMLRSFEYAAHHRMIETGYQPQLVYRATEWANRNRDAFLDGYARAAGHDPREQPVPLRALEADKAVYEAVYEARHRPAWLPIPLASLARLAEST